MGRLDHLFRLLLQSQHLALLQTVCDCGCAEFVSDEVGIGLVVDQNLAVVLLRVVGRFAGIMRNLDAGLVDGV